MKWTLLGFLGLGCILTIASASGMRLLGQQPNNPYNQQPPYGGAQYPQYGQTFQPGSNGPPAGPYQFPKVTTKPGPDGKPVTTTEMVTVNGNPRHNEDRQALREAQSKLRSPDASESDKKEARTTIEKFLGDEFERDQKMRREQVTRLEEQVSKLRNQLDKREQSKSKIIELRMQLLENDAEGLSFPESFNELQRGDGNHNPYGPMPGQLHGGIMPSGMLPYNPGPVYYAQPGNPLLESSSPNLSTRELIDLRNRVPGLPIPPNEIRPIEAKQPK